MSAESDLLNQVEHPQIQSALRVAIASGWRVDRHRRGTDTVTYLIWPTTKETVMVPFSDWDAFRGAARKMEGISETKVLSHSTRHRQRKFVSAKAEQPATKVLKAPIKPDMTLRLEQLRKEHHDLSWEFKILVWESPETNTPDELNQARIILRRIHVIEETLLEMGQPLSERTPTTR